MYVTLLHLMKSEKALKTLDDFVVDCYLNYAAQGIEVGDPTYEWEEAHHDLPACMGGIKTVTLMRKDHAIHGVLQSEAFQRPCIYGWEVSYLEGEILDLYRKWKREHCRRAGRQTAINHPNRNFGFQKGDRTMADLPKEELLRRVKLANRAIIAKTSIAIQAIDKEGNVYLFPSAHDLGRYVGSSQGNARRALEKGYLLKGMKLTKIEPNPFY